jgi:hypothetical protein
VQLAALAYADDVALLASSPADLQASLHLLHTHCGRWRMRVNASKTKVMVTTPVAKKVKPKEQAVHSADEFTLGSRALTQVESYEYLGVTLTSDLQWTAHKAAVIQRAERALNIVAGAGLSRGLFSAEMAQRLWKVLVRPVIEYCSPVWGGGKWKAADGLQYRAGRVILRVMDNTPKAAVRGELGWQRMEARRELLAIRYWCGLLPFNGSDPRRYVVKMYQADRRQLNIASSSRAIAGRAASLAWLARGCLELHGLQKYWDAQDRKLPAGDMNDYHAHGHPLSERWNCSASSLMGELKPALAKLEQQVWSDEVRLLTSLRTYVQVKKRLEMEAYLRDAGGVGTVSVAARTAAMDMARLRCGTNALAISSARRGDRMQSSSIGSSAQRRTGSCQPVPLQQRVCAWCAERLQQPDMAPLRGAGTVPVEDEEHALLWCGLYSQSRLQLFDIVRTLTAVRDGTGQHVLANGPVDLHDLTRSPQSTDGQRAAALAIILGGVHGRQVGKVKCSSQQRRVDHDLQQACKSYVGVITRQRREWHKMQTQVLSARSQSTPAAHRLHRGALAGKARRGGLGGGGGGGKTGQWSFGAAHERMRRGSSSVPRRVLDRSRASRQQRSIMQQRQQRTSNADGDRQPPSTRALSLPGASMSALSVCHVVDCDAEPMPSGL